MGPKKKKNPKNDFYFFMNDHKKVLQRQGRPWNTMDELVAICHPLFKNLPDHEKQRYKNMAKRYKEEHKHDLTNKFDQSGRCLQDIKNEQDEKNAFMQNMSFQLESLMQKIIQDGTFLKQKFYFIHCNTLCETSEGVHIPCEIAVVEFSVEEGVSKIFQSFINPPNIPTGYSYEIKKKADETHKISLELEGMNHKAAKSYSWIVRKLFSMICPNVDSSTIPNLFTLPGEAEKTKQILDNLLNWGDCQKKLQVFHIDLLFYNMSKSLKSDCQIGNQLLALSFLEKEQYQYTLDNACYFHEEIDNSMHCSLFVARKWAYIISSYICPQFGIKFIPGRHLPPDSKGPNILKRLDPIQVQVDYENWEVDEEYKTQPERNFMGAKITKANPSGHSFETLEDFSSLNFRSHASNFGGVVDHGASAWDSPSKASNVREDSVDAQQFPSLRSSEGFESKIPTSESKSASSNFSWSNTASASVVQGASLFDATSAEDFPSLGSKLGNFQGRHQAKGGLNKQMKDLNLQ